MPWLVSLIEDAKSSEMCIARYSHDKLWDRCKDMDAAIGALKGIVPWNANRYVNFQSVPKTSKTGVVHVAFLNS